MTATATEQNRALLRKMYDAALRGDLAGLIDHLADDVEVREPDFLPYGGVYRKADFAQLLSKIDAVLDLSRLSITHLLADGDTVMATIRIPDRRTGQRVLLIERSVVHEGQVSEMEIFFHDVQSLTQSQS